MITIVITMSMYTTEDNITLYEYTFQNWLLWPRGRPVGMNITLIRGGQRGVNICVGTQGEGGVQGVGQGVRISH